MARFMRVRASTRSNDADVDARLFCHYVYAVIYPRLPHIHACRRLMPTTLPTASS